MISLDILEKSKNIVELLDKEEQYAIAQQVVKGYEIDEESREDWKETVEKAMDMAKQKTEPKNYPWPGASNIKFPLITKAAYNYAARTMPEIIQNDKVVKCAVIGSDPDGAKYDRARRVSDYMSNQFVNEIQGWEDGLDNMLQILAVTGMAFKKTYYNVLRKQVCSELCLPHKIVVNHDTQNMESAKRITHLITLSQNDIVERQRSGIFNEDVELESLRTNDLSDEHSSETLQDEDYTVELLEQHCFLDLDEDGYKEPYIVTVHRTSKQVMRIVSRFKTIKKNSDGDVVFIEPIQYYTDYHFLPSSDGGFYSVGFGTLMLPLNASVNTILNQLVNAGTLATTTTGIISRGLRIKNGEFKLKMGEYVVHDAAGTTDISKAIYTLPFKEPSQVLFNLLELLIQVCEQISSTTDVTQGQNPSQNVSSGVASQQLEQATKLFGGINKRVYRSLKREYEKVYELNYKFLDNKSYRNVLDDEAADVKKDFECDSLAIYPIADPTMSSIAQRLTKAIAVQQLKTVDARAADTYLLDSLQLDKSQIDVLLPPADPNAPPPPEAQKITAEIALIQAQIAAMTADFTLKQQANELAQLNMQREMTWTEAQIQESATRNWKAQKDAAHNDLKVSLLNKKLDNEHTVRAIDLNLKNEQIQATKQINEVVAQSKLAKVSTDADLGAAKLSIDLHKHSVDTVKDIQMEGQPDEEKRDNGEE